MLDFDFEKLCSITLSNVNVYACLVCGRYYQGKGKGTHAYLHSLEENHHVFINLHNQKIYCLPDNYEVDDPSLEDIKYNLKPFYSKEQLAQLDKNTQYVLALDGTEYLPGYAGLNNIKFTDYVNVILQSLFRISNLRDHYLFNQLDVYASDALDLKNLLSRRWADLLRKVWNPRRFKAHVSPHELLQAISLKSEKKFQINEQSDPTNFLAWFMETLHEEYVDSTNKQNSKLVS